MFFLIVVDGGRGRSPVPAGGPSSQHRVPAPGGLGRVSERRARGDGVDHHRPARELSLRHPEHGAHDLALRGRPQRGQPRVRPRHEPGRGGERHPRRPGSPARRPSPGGESPGIWKFDPNAREIVSISATSTRDLEQLTRVLEREIGKRFEQIPGVGAIEISGGIHREVRVQLRRDRLKAAGLTASDVQQALARENVQLPGGNVKEGLTDRYVRTLGEFSSVEEIGAAVVALRDGRPIRVRDVADVADGYEDVRNLTELDGVPVVRMGIQKQSGANTVAVAQDIREEVDRINADRSDLELTVTSDQSVFIRQSMSSVQSAALWGGLLAIFVLYLFLRNGSTTSIIALSIPISVIATFGLLYFTGLTLNQMTFGGLALGIGLIVDNAIVVLESIVRQRQQGKRSLKEAALVGTRQVSGAIVAATLTTCVIFLPVVFMRTTSGQLFQTLALVVVFALACSLLVALTLVPMLASRFMTVQPAGEGEADAAGAAEGADVSPTARPRASRFQAWFEGLENWYARRLSAAFAHKGKVLGATAALVAAAIVAIPFVPVELAPQLDSDEIDIEFGDGERNQPGRITLLPRGAGSPGAPARSGGRRGVDRHRDVGRQRFDRDPP